MLYGSEAWKRRTPANHSFTLVIPFCWPGPRAVFLRVSALDSQRFVLFDVLASRLAADHCFQHQSATLATLSQSFDIIVRDYRITGTTHPMKHQLDSKVASSDHPLSSELMVRGPEQTFRALYGTVTPVVSGSDNARVGQARQRILRGSLARPGQKY